MPLRVALAVDDEIDRRGLLSAFDEDPMIDVVIETDGQIDGEGLDVAVVSWPRGSDLELRCPQVVLASADETASLRRRSEIVAILHRRGLTSEQIMVAVRAAAAGLRVDSSPLGAATDDLLDERQLVALRLLGDGADTRTIARELRYSERTIKTLVHEIELTLGARNRAQAVAEAFRLGLI